MQFKLIIIAYILILCSCRKKPVDEPVQPIENGNKKGWLILNEGLFQQNNSTLGFYNSISNEYIFDFFKEISGRPLGDTGNDMQAYGNKIYIVVNVSSSIEVLNRKTGEFIAQIPMLANGQAKQPRYITFSGSKAFVSCFDGFVDVIDTVTLTVTKRIAVGNNPEQLVVSNDRLFVANSGGLNAPDLDSTVSIISLQTEMEEQKITVGKNPGVIKKSSNGNLVVLARGDYNKTKPKVVKINLSNFQTSIVPLENVYSMEIMENRLIFAEQGSKELKLWNLDQNLVESSNYIDISALTTLYSIQYDKQREVLYLFDSRGYVNTGKVYQYSESGGLQRIINTGIIPTKIYEFD